jgi:hypothetical protein
LRISSRKRTKMKNSNESDLWVLTFTTDDSDPHWETRSSIVGTEEQIARVLDLKRLPYGARLLKGKQAARYLRQSLKEEQRYQREQLAKRQAGGAN